MTLLRPPPLAPLPAPQAASACTFARSRAATAYDALRLHSSPRPTVPPAPSRSAPSTQICLPPTPLWTRGMTACWGTHLCRRRRFLPLLPWRRRRRRLAWPRAACSRGDGAPCVRRSGTSGHCWLRKCVPVFDETLGS